MATNTVTAHSSSSRIPYASFQTINVKCLSQHGKKLPFTLNRNSVVEELKFQLMTGTAFSSKRYHYLFASAVACCVLPKCWEYRSSQTEVLDTAAHVFLASTSLIHHSRIMMSYFSVNCNHTVESTFHIAVSPFHH